uniref:Putative GPI-anchored adhesin-like protein PGA55 isoform X1 n=1 Tax=Davidia involucrata TaxID=16924 RepID=A0A5B7BSB4_DAVIN
MTSLTTTWSPNSLAFNCRKYHTIFVGMRVQKLDRQILLFSVAGDGGRNNNGVARRRTGNSWMISNSSVNAFSGRSDAEGGEQSNDSQRKRWLGGIVGAGVAGVILVAGLTFATLSISKRNTSRPAKEMEPLTTQQEVSLSLDDLNDRVEENGNESKNMTQDDNSLESKTGIEKDSSSYIKNNEPSIENRLSDETDVVYTFNGGDVINNVSIQEDLQIESAIDDISVAPDRSPGKFKPPESEIADGSFVASNENSDGSPDTDISEPTSELKENLIDAKLTHSSVSDTYPTNLYADHQEGVPGSRETVDFSSSFDSSSSSIVHVPSESPAFNISLNSQLDSVLESQIVHKENIEAVNLLSTKEDLDLSKMQEVSSEGNNSSLEVHNLNGGGSSGTTSVSALAYPFANEHDATIYNDINGSRSFLESTNPGNSFSSAGIPAPSVVSAALQVLPGKVLVPAVVDQVQGQALAALQVLKVIEADVQPSDLCTRREYARWLVSASSALSRNTVSKVYPAMYIENFTELAFDDITREDPDFPSIQGLAEAGLISSKLSRHDMHCSLDEDQSSFCFYPESPLSRQDLVTWKIAIEKTLLPEADRKILHQLSGFIDIDKIHSDACPALVADLSAGEQGIIALAFGYTRLFQPDKPVTKAQAAIALATCEASDIVSEELARIEAESMAENAVAAHSALVAQVEKDVNASFEKELSIEREKIDAVEKLAEEARQELERLRTEREEDNIALMKERATVESEMEVLSRLRREVEEQLQSLMSNKVEISHDKERLSKLWKEAEIENQESARLQYELEVERKALSMTRAWAEDEAKRAREQAKALEEARYRWEKHGIKVIVDNDLREEANAGVTWLNAGKQFSVEGTVCRAENLVDKLKAMAADVRGKSRDTIDIIIQKILFLISILKEWVSKAGIRAAELKDAAASKVGGSLQEFQQSSAEFTLALKEGAKRVAGDCREGVDKFTQKFKT